MKKIIIILTIVSIYSCNQEQITNNLPKESTVNVSIVEGRMKFETSTDLENFVSQYSTDTGFIVPSILVKQHISHLAKVKSINEAEGIAPDTLKIGDPVLSKILNENLEMQIGERIYKYSPSLHFLYVYNAFAHQQIDSLIAVESQVKEQFNCLSEDKHFEISKGIEIYYSSNPMFIVDTLVIREDIGDAEYSGQIRPTAVREFNDRRLTLTRWETSAIVYASFGYEIKFEKKAKWLFVKYWADTNADLYLSWPETKFEMRGVGRFDIVPAGNSFQRNVTSISKTINSRTFASVGYMYFALPQPIRGYVIYNGTRYNIEQKY